MPTNPDPPPSPSAAKAPINSATWTGNADTSRFFDRQRDTTRAAFVVHLDAPWGGGKTTFANFLARVLNPYGFEQGKSRFLRERYGEDADISTIFLQDPPSPNEAGRKDDPHWPDDARRPWIIVSFNAWQVEHCAPPWWVFYQAIRLRCFASVLGEGNGVVGPGGTAGERKAKFRDRFPKWLALWICEYWWRLKNPKITMLMATSLVSLAVLALLYSLDLVHLSGKPGEEKLGFNLSDGIGLMLAGITTLGTIWAFGALLTESIVPGTNTVAERLSLGGGDPFERFRKHFYSTMERVKRPVLVIVDDLDRCKPDFVVDLIRGMQTLLRSPRVVFVIVGDRDWIERAFEAYHRAMNKVRVGPEQTLGARFVEKAIQMSFVLPGMVRERQTEYVHWVLLGARAVQRGANAIGIKPETAALLREEIQRNADALTEAPLATEKIKETVKLLYSGLPSDTVDQFVNEELAIRAAVDERVEREISHRLQPLSAYFPPNPRQIKRIVNAVTMYYAVALQQSGLKSDDPLWFQLARWIIIMIEWPETWRLLASYPDLADLLITPDPEGNIKKMEPSNLPGSETRTLKEVNRIRADDSLMALIAGSDGRVGPIPPPKAQATGLVRDIGDKDGNQAFPVGGKIAPFEMTLGLAAASLAERQ
jgi:hypothetical protein